MLALALFAVLTLAMGGMMAAGAVLRESSRNRIQAMNDIRTVTEAIRDRSGSGLAAVTQTNWTDWARQNGVTALEEEAVTVTYADPSADPLKVTVQVAWRERNRNRMLAMSTRVTSR